MTRISSLAANAQLMNFLFKTQNKLHDSEVQLSSEKLSQTYSGLALNSRRLVGLENTDKLAERFINNNTIMGTRMDIADTAAESLRETINNFRQRLGTFRSAEPTSQNVQDIQIEAFQTLLNMQDYLNTQADGQYVFSGSRVNKAPVELDLSSLANFQSKYDGITDTYPTTREGHLASLNISSDPENVNHLFVDVDNHLTFRQDDDGDATTSGRSSIEATTPQFANVKAGARITVTGTTDNNGTYTVDSVSSDGTKVYLNTEMLTNETVSTAITTQDITNGLVAEAATATVAFSIVSGAGTGAGTYTMSFDATTMTISDDGTLGTLSGGLATGDRIQISGSGSNDGIYTVETIPGADSFVIRVDDPLTTDASDAATIEHPTGSGTTAAFGNLSFNNANGQIIDNLAAGTLSAGWTVGDTFTISGSASNDGDYVVAALPNSDTITIERLDATITPAGGSAISLSSIGNMTIDSTGGNISARTSGAFDSISVGDTITLANTARGGIDNDADYIVTGKTGDVLDVVRAPQITNATGGAISVATAGNLTFNRSAGTITAANTNAFSTLAVGETIVVGRTEQNDGTYTIESISSDGTTITVIDQKLVDEGLSSGSTFFDYSVGSQMTFTQNTGVNDGTIEIQPNGGGTALTGTFNSFEVGDTITVTNTAAHNGTYTINAISSDGSTITVDGDLGSTADDTDGANLASSARNFSYVTGTQYVFDATNDTIQIQDSGGTGIPDFFKSLRVGQTFTMTGAANAGNNQTYTVSAINANGDTITVNEDIPTDETENTDARIQVFAADGTITANSWYQGDETAINHRVSENRDFDYDITAVHPAFEKAIRAIGMIAQGVFGTEGGLDQNMGRVDDALFLLNSALVESDETNPDFPNESTANMVDLQKDLVFQRLLIDRANQEHESNSSFFKSKAAELENADMLTVITELQASSRALEASYQALARVQNLSLLNFFR